MAINIQIDTFWTKSLIFALISKAKYNHKIMKLVNNASLWCFEHVPIASSRLKLTQAYVFTNVLMNMSKYI